MHISEVEKSRAAKENRMRNSHHDSEERERDKLIKKFHEQGEDVARITVDVNPMEQLKKEGKCTQKDYGYDPVEVIYDEQLLCHFPNKCARNP